jgi:hypothetical protein
MEFWNDVHYITERFNQLIHLINPLWFVVVWVLVHLWFNAVYSKFTTVEYINNLASLPDFQLIEKTFWRKELVFKAPKFAVDLLSNLIFLFYTPVSYELKTYIFLIIVFGFLLKSIPIIFGRTNLILYFRDFFDLLTIGMLFILGITMFDSWIVKISLFVTLILLLLRIKVLFFAPVKIPDTNNFYNRRYFTVELLSIRESHEYIDIFYKLMTALMLMTIDDFSFIIPLIGCHLFFVYLRKLSFTDGYSTLTSSKISYFDTNGIPFEYIGILLGAILATIAFFSREVEFIVPIAALFVILMILFRKQRARKFDETNNFYLIVDPSARVKFNKLALRLYRRVVYVNPNKNTSVFNKLESLLNGISNDLIVLNAFSFHYRLYKSTFSTTEISNQNVRNIIFVHDHKKLETDLDDEVLSITEYQLNQSLQNVYCCIDFFDFDVLLATKEKEGYLLSTSLDRIRLQMEAAYEKIASTDELLIRNDAANKMSLPLEEKINIELSLEGSKHNHYLLKFVFQQAEIDAVKTISKKGIHELSTIFRQMHEDPSPSTRFMEIINLCEILSCYCMAILYAKNEVTGEPFWMVSEDKKNKNTEMPNQVSFGAIMSRLRLWMNEFNHLENTSILAKQLYDFLHFPLSGLCQFDHLSDFAFFDLTIGENAKRPLKGKVTIQTFLDFITSVRNKTRGHGAMTKVDFEVYVELEVIVLHLLNQFSLFPGNMVNLVKTEKNDVVALSYKTGGVITMVPEQWEDRNKYLNPYLKDAELIELEKISTEIKQISEKLVLNKMYWYIQDEEVNEIWNLENFIQVNNGKAYLFSERKENGTKHFISYSTGKHSNLKDVGIDLKN